MISFPPTSTMKSVILALAAVFTVVLSSCGNSYQRGFAEATAALPRPTANAEGPWVGTWKSDVNGHTGPLWCIVQPTPDRPGDYNFRYRAGWGMLKFGDYIHTTPAKLAADGSMKLSGEMALPGGMGTYRVEGRLTRDSFNATYRSEADHGTMAMKRPASGAGD
jgi:hypothetical protein